MVFNDGTKTYIQHRKGQDISAPDGHVEGPYVVIDGTPERFVFVSNGHTVTARWKSANSFIGGSGVTDAVRGDQPQGFTGFSDRIALIGAHPNINVVRGVSSTMPVGSLVKALAPQGWSGVAAKDIDLTAPISFSTLDGENWLQALNRLMSATNLYASVDFTKERIRLDRQAPKSGTEGLIAMPAMEQGTTAAPRPHTDSASRLAATFGATAIRDSDDTHIQIRFAQRPAAQLKFQSPDGRSLHPEWNRDAPVVTLDRAPSFVVTDGISRVTIDRELVTIYDFPSTNDAHLLGVFDAQGNTFFKFSPGVIKASVTNGQGIEEGEQRGTNYMYRGTADTFKVQADGVSVSVKRRVVTRFNERATS
jgi:hypothetical protein